MRSHTSKKRPKKLVKSCLSPRRPMYGRRHWRLVAIFAKEKPYDRMHEKPLPWAIAWRKDETLWSHAWILGVHTITCMGNWHKILAKEKLQWSCTWERGYPRSYTWEWSPIRSHNMRKWASTIVCLKKDHLWSLTLKNSQETLKNGVSTLMHFEMGYLWPCMLELATFFAKEKPLRSIMLRIQH